MLSAPRTPGHAALPAQGLFKVWIPPQCRPEEASDEGPGEGAVRVIHKELRLSVAATHRPRSLGCALRLGVQNLGRDDSETDSLCVLDHPSDHRYWLALQAALRYTACSYDGLLGLFAGESMLDGREAVFGRSPTRVLTSTGGGE